MDTRTTVTNGERKQGRRRSASLVLVPIEAMTDDELTAKAAEYRRLADRHYRHATELERYRDQR